MLDLGAQATTNIFDNVLDAPYEFAQIVSIQEIKAFHHSGIGHLLVHMGRILGEFRPGWCIHMN